MSDDVLQARKPTPRESALLLALLIRRKEEESGKALTRVRVAEISLRRLWLRNKLTDNFISEVKEWFEDSGWALIETGTTYAAIKITTIDGWARLSSKRLAAEINSVRSGRFEFSSIEHLLQPTDASDEDGDESGDA
ncbi:hypothetical protein G3545_13770 [Starkeya sp. ORNL1]|uniref:hypothetical protein n=1 Tax=Starkeya sp. ORNL1 TaxID=2709380 RepID=UPI0014641ADE|nr:hypothetical protein [Starkeya sp. ORNL1]QJP14618.1 hypothetical protein G3545_13770 [Starkeya sp. ORNL1]